MNQQIIQDNLLRIRERVAHAADKSGRTPEEITIVAVTKAVHESVIRQAYQIGHRVFGENRIQEAIPKIEALDACFGINWHMIGHLQSNKVRKAVEKFAIIQSVDSLDLARKIARFCRESDRQIEILLEINVSGEASKSGLSPVNLMATSAEIENLSEIVPRGLMTVGPLTTDRRIIRKAFETLRECLEKVAASGIFGINFNILSMGMTDDYEIAVEEGSNMVRIGRGIFGERVIV